MKPWHKVIFDKNDSIMELLRRQLSKSSLYIVPEKSANIAKFVSGINNKIKQVRIGNMVN